MLRVQPDGTMQDVERDRFIGPVPMAGDHTEIMSPLNWRTCKECGIEMLLPHEPHPDAPTIDHILPVVEGWCSLPGQRESSALPDATQYVAIGASLISPESNRTGRCKTTK